MLYCYTHTLSSDAYKDVQLTTLVTDDKASPMHSFFFNFIFSLFFLLD